MPNTSPGPSVFPLAAVRPLSRLAAAGRVPAAALALGWLAGCGGGGGGGSTLPPPALSVAPSIALESAGQMPFTVTLEKNAEWDVQLHYSTADLVSTLASKAVPGYARGGASCSAGIDYVAVNNGAFTIPTGQRTATVQVTICNDATLQADKRFNLTVNGGASPSTAVGTIVNDDAGGLNDTGISACVNASGGATGCPAGGLAGQDAETGRDALSLVNSDADGLKGFSFEKVGASGESLAANAAGWSCVRDRVTGLLWQVEQATGTPETMPFADVAARITAANSASLCGVSNWRLPEVAELASLVAAGKTSGVAIDSNWFADTAGLANQQTSIYWTDTTYPDDDQTDWTVDFGLGAVGVKNKAPGNSFSLRLVSGAESQPSSATPCLAGSAKVASDRFADNGDGTVTDKRTQLMWMQCSQGRSGTSCGSGTAASVDWAGALSAAAAANGSASLGKGYTDWRLPNRNELASLVEYACRAPAINQTYFPSTVLASYWSSSPVLPISGSAWYVNFVDGDVGPATTDGPRAVRLVRAGH
ncbi:hypothetical protein GCM10023144_23030 [Pigmentiphaga soli]|uniref:Lcl C-terminal domain-containing protein n=1 Tax=Pigmentiphaga soli TaxID=1007095 RepID=A0ABP8H0L3_9BURK